ncbi:hypothetical protein HY418_03490 [Candidatus Kaiserbacteria bacterium]|nr:hypothetical protein [Candidatus Kaiserbacteria bacterium]
MKVHPSTVLTGIFAALAAVSMIITIGISADVIHPLKMPFVSQVHYQEAAPALGGAPEIDIMVTHRWGIDWMYFSADSTGELQFVLLIRDDNIDKAEGLDRRAVTVDEWAAWTNRFASLRALVNDERPSQVMWVWPGT